MTETTPNWQEEVVDGLKNALFQRWIITMVINETLKTGVKTPMKDGVILNLKAQQLYYTKQIEGLKRKLDRGTAD